MYLSLDHKLIIFRVYQSFRKVFNSRGSFTDTTLSIPKEEKLKATFHMVVSVTLE